MSVQVGHRIKTQFYALFHSGTEYSSLHLWLWFPGRTILMA
jgi:hypothetical protein